MMILKNGWRAEFIVDDDGHLNIYINNDDNGDIYEIDTGQGDGINEQLAIRVTTSEIEWENTLHQEIK